MTGLDIRDKMREHQQWWIGYMMLRWDEENLAREINGPRFEGRRGRGRSKFHIINLTCATSEVVFTTLP